MSLTLIVLQIQKWSSWGSNWRKPAAKSLIISSNPSAAIRRCLAFSVRRATIQVCANNLRFQDEVTQVLIHELIHAYDQCRAKNMDWGNRTHRACTEIRASRLSGDCHFLRELLRGNFKIIGHEQACVKRRVVNSMTGTNTNCSKIAATIAMEVVWDTCYNDTAPFDKAPWIITIFLLPNSVYDGFKLAIEQWPSIHVPNK